MLLKLLKLLEILVDDFHPSLVARHNVVAVHVFDGEPTTLLLPMLDEVVGVVDGVSDGIVVSVGAIATDTPTVPPELPHTILRLDCGDCDQELPVFVFKKVVGLWCEGGVLAF